MPRPDLARAVRALVLPLALLLCAARASLGASAAAPSLYVDGEKAVTLSESSLWSVIAGCFGAGALFSIAFVLWWRYKFARETPPSLFVAKERWEKQPEYPRGERSCLNAFCAIQ